MRSIVKPTLRAAVLGLAVLPFVAPLHALPGDGDSGGDDSVLCPISGKKVSPEVWVFSEGKKIGLCCEDCRKRFTRERENRLSPQEEKDGWRLVFNGRNTDGFTEPTRTGKWEVKDGVLRGGGGPGVLGTKERYGDFVLRLDARVSDTGERRGNSGVFIRSSGLLAMRGRWPDGPEIQIAPVQ